MIVCFALLAAEGQDLLGSGQAAFARGDLPAAETAFRAHLKAHPKSAEAMSNLAAVLSRKGVFNEAIDLYGKALAASPSLTQIHFNLGVAQLKAGQYRDAAASLGLYLKHHSTDMRARQLLGLSLVETGDLASAIQELEQVYRANPADASVGFSLAYAHARGGSAERGAELLSRVMGNPAQASLLRGIMNYREGRFDEARTEFTRALEHDPALTPALAAVGRLYLRENKDPDAIRYLEKALQGSPHDAETAYQLGVLYDRNGRGAEGRQLLERAIQLRARYPDPHYQLARIFHREGQNKLALSQVNKAVDLLPEHEAIRLLRARIYQALGQAKLAQAEFAEVRRLKASVVERAQKNFDSEIALKE